MKVFISLVFCLLSMACSKESTVPLDVEVKLILEELESSMSYRRLGAPVAVKFRDPELANQVFMLGQESGLSLVSEEEFKVTAGSLLEFGEVFWGEGGTLHLPVIVYGETDYQFWSIFKPNFEKSLYLMKGGVTSDWQPVSLDAEAP